MKKCFNILILKIIYLLIRRLDISRSRYVTRKDNVKLWGISEQIEAIVARMENDYEDYSYSEEFRCYVHKDTIINRRK